MNNQLAKLLILFIPFLSGCMTSNYWEDAGKQSGVPSRLLEAKLSEEGVLEIRYEVKYFNQSNEELPKKTKVDAGVYFLKDFNKCLVQKKANKDNELKLNEYDCFEIYLRTNNYNRPIILPSNYTFLNMQSNLPIENYQKSDYWLKEEILRNECKNTPRLYLLDSGEHQFVLTFYDKINNECNFYKIQPKPYNDINRFEQALKRTFYLLADVVTAPIQGIAFLILALTHINP